MMDYDQLKNVNGHLIFSRKLLGCCNQDVRSAFFTVIPFLLGGENLYHRLYAHSLGNLPELVDVTIDIFSSIDPRDHYKKKSVGVLQSTLASLEREITQSNKSSKQQHLERKQFFYSKILENLESIFSCHHS